MPASNQHVVCPVAFVRSPYSDTKQVPKGLGARQEAEGTIEFLREFENGLADIEGFSHLYVIWVFHRAEGYELFGVPPCDDRPHGVFASRSPYRPNHLGLSLVRLIERAGPRLRVRGIDMVDGTPVLDVKPCLSPIAGESLRRGWLAEAEGRKRAGGGDDGVCG
jgi:tRNA-Thr(GGU) m(6)t(6)A37 methyltransferase TsaA